MVGHDYNEFLSTLLDTYLNIRNNGYSIQWFTPGFGGGLPAFHSPQHMQYSIPQFLMLFLDPWASVIGSLLIYSFIGYWAFYRLGRDVLNLRWETCVLGATFFTVNGFMIEHAAAGHVGYQVFPLVSVFIYCILATKSRMIKSGLVIGLCIVLMFFSGGFYSLLIFMFSIFLTIPLLLIFYPDTINIKHIFTTGILGAVSGLAMSVGKLYAVYTFMRYFPRLISHQYYSNFTDSFRGFIGQILGVMFFVPFSKIRKGDGSQALDYIKSYISEIHGIWEKDISISPVLLILCFLGVLWVIMNLHKVFAGPPHRKQQGIGIILLFLFVWITFEVISTRGNFYDFFHSLPVLSSLHVNFRFAAAFILPSAIFGAMSFDRITIALASKTRTVCFLILNFLALAFVLTYFSLSPDIQKRTTDIDMVLKTYQLVKEGKNFTVEKIINNKNETELFMENASNLYPVHGVFGYSLDSTKFPTELTEGSVYQVSDGYLNFNNPIGFVYPEESGVMAFERFRVEDEELLKDFLARKQIQWPIPLTQKVLNVFSLMVFLGILGFLGYQGVTVVWRRYFQR
jgi:hypothetical protein